MLCLPPMSNSTPNNLVRSVLNVCPSKYDCPYVPTTPSSEPIDALGKSVCICKQVMSSRDPIRCLARPSPSSPGPKLQFLLSRVALVAQISRKRTLILITSSPLAAIHVVHTQAHQSEVLLQVQHKSQLPRHSQVYHVIIWVAALISMTVSASSVSGFAVGAALSASAGSSPECQRTGDPYPFTMVWDECRGMTPRKISRVLWSWNPASSAARVDRAFSLPGHLCSAQAGASGLGSMTTHAARTELI